MTIVNGNDVYPRVTEVLKITDTEIGAGTYDVQIKIQWKAGEASELIGSYRSAPYDTSPINAQLRAWMAANPSAPVHAYVAPPPPTTEERCAAMPRLTARQFRQGLVNAGISPSAVTAKLDALPAGADKDKALIEWEYATEFNRLHPLVATVSVELGLTAEQVDAMWVASVGL
ncbi:hypothetical protein [Sinorhizobium phage phiM5]|nr:hypothetical protein [Sinorhizobium phage phiM5]